MCSLSFRCHEFLKFESVDFFFTMRTLCRHRRSLVSFLTALRSRYALWKGMHQYKSLGATGFSHRARSRKKGTENAVSHRPQSYRAADQNRQADAATPDATLHAARPGDAACRRARRGPGSGLHGAAARALLAPRTNPKNRHEFKRVNGPYTLYMVAGGGNKLPYGTLPRLLMAWCLRSISHLDFYISKYLRIYTLCLQPVGKLLLNDFAHIERRICLQAGNLNVPV